jgi:hypothetical protein
MSFIEVLDRLDAIAGYLQTDANERLGVHNLLHVQDRKEPPAHGGSFTHGAWRTRTLTTSVINNIAGASLANNRITLPAGTYYVRGSGCAVVVDNHITRIQDVTNNVTLVTGLVASAAVSGGVVSDAVVAGVFTLAASADVELQHRCAVTRADFGFGACPDMGQAFSVYADVQIWKLS